jgi:two-component system cell cycle response regulator
MLVPRRILIADDDLAVREGLVDCLQPLGLVILQAESGPQALEIARGELTREALHLLLSDVHMPGFGGLELLERLGEVVSGGARPACIFYSGNATREIESRALAAGARAFLHKPVEPRVLREEVVRALDGDLFYEARPIP